MRLLQGDCLDVMAELADNSVDCICTDPPYGLSFMGKQWDHGVPGQPFWEQALRVAKPGAQLVAFGGTRTYHRLVVAIEDAGWQIRDCVMWVYGSGFPKSMDIGKALDKQAGRDFAIEQEIAEYVRSVREAKGLSAAEVDQRVFGGTTRYAFVEGRTNTGGLSRYMPTPEEWQKLRAVLEIDDRYDAYIALIPNRKNRALSDGGRSNLVEKVAQTHGYQRDGSRWVGDQRITRPVSSHAKVFDGYGTALKPSYEPVILAMKPLDGTFADNALHWGVAGLNIDGSRTPGIVQSAAGVLGGYHGHSDDEAHYKKGTGRQYQGRWPPNLLLSHSWACIDECVDDCPVAEMDRQSGIKRSGRSAVVQSAYDGTSHTGLLRGVSTPNNQYDDQGGASRFFPRFRYNGKVSRKERGDSAHPTMKPIAVVEWLLRLIAPPVDRPQGVPVVLDPFMGSGTTGVAAKRLGLDFIGIDLENDYVEIARRRINGDATAEPGEPARPDR